MKIGVLKLLYLLINIHFKNTVQPVARQAM